MTFYTKEDKEVRITPCEENYSALSKLTFSLVENQEVVVEIKETKEIIRVKIFDLIFNIIK